MTLHQLVLAVASSAGITQKLARQVIRLSAIHIARACHRGERVDIPDFGVFERGSRKARRIRNLDGTEMQLPRIESLKFRAAKAQKRRRSS